jgi:hypothetical protein
MSQRFCALLPVLASALLSLRSIVSALQLHSLDQQRLDLRASAWRGKSVLVSLIQRKLAKGTKACRPTITKKLVGILSLAYLELGSKIWCVDGSQFNLPHKIAIFCV